MRTSLLYHAIGKMSMPLSLMFLPFASLRSIPGPGHDLPPHKRKRVPNALFQPSSEGYWQDYAGRDLTLRGSEVQALKPSILEEIPPKSPPK